MIKLLTTDELPLCYEGGKLFFGEGKLPGGFDPTAFQLTWGGMIATGAGIVYGMFNGNKIEGALGGIIHRDLNNFDMVAVECFWYMLPGSRGNGIALLNEFESWAKLAGAKRVAMIHLTNLQPEILRKLYERRGYKEIEVHYVKEL